MRKPYIFLSFLTVFLMIYYPALNTSYGYHDEFMLFDRVPGQWSLHLAHNISFYTGRWLTAYLATGIGWLVDSVSDLNGIRLVSIFFLSVTSYLCYWLMRRIFAQTLPAFCATALIFTLPPFQLAAAWLGSFVVSLTVLLATGAALLADKIPLTGSGKRLLNPNMARAVVLLFAGLSFYPPAAMFYWVIVAVMIVAIQGDPVDQVKKRLLNLMIPGLVAIAFYALVLQLLKSHHAPYASGIYNPYTVETDYLRKLIWFIKEPLFNSLNLWNIFPQSSYAAVVAGFLLLSGGLAVYRDAKKSICFLPLLLLLVILAFLPNLVATSDSPFYRCCAALTSLILIWLIWAIRSWTGLCPGPQRQSVLTGILLVSCLFAAYQARQTVWQYRVSPSHRELAFIKDAIHPVDLNRIRGIHINRPPLTFVPRRYDEFGTLTTHFPEDIRLIIVTAVRELALEKNLRMTRYDINGDTGVVTYVFQDMSHKNRSYQYDFVITSREDGIPVDLNEPTLVIDMMQLKDFQTSG